MHPLPPQLEGLTWRPVTVDDLPALSDLALECHASDGGLAFLALPENLKDRCFSDASGAAIGAFDAQGCLAAFETIRFAEMNGRPLAVLTGHVRPDLRGRGLGTHLIQWGAQTARELFPAGEELRLRVATEALTEPARQLYLAHGFDNVFEELVMRRDLNGRLPDQSFPPDIAIATWEPGIALQFFEAYDAAFRERPGFPGYTAEEWITGYRENEELRPEWSLLARAGEAPAGFVFGSAEYSGGYIIQVGVIPAQRRRGLASALLVESMRRMQAAGLTVADLCVHLNNPGAIQAYAGIGFTEHGRRARFDRLKE